jgi:ribonuclease HI
VKEILLFTDGSVNVQTKIGFGASLSVKDIEQPLSSLRKDLELQRFENTSSAKMELEILLWALRKIEDEVAKVIIYTDSQNIISLPLRRSRFEENNYSSKKNKRIRNYKLYQEFYQLTDKLNCELVKVRGHQQMHQKDRIHKIFTLVDRASRKALRDENQK